MTMSLLIPVAVGRAVIASTAWKEAGHRDVTPVYGRFDIAVARDRSRTQLFVDTEAHVAGVEDLIERVRLEQTKKPVIKAIEAFQADLNRLGKRVSRVRQYQQRQQEETKAQLRSDARKRRERPLALEVDTQQIDDLKEIAEDYDLNLHDPVIRAALTAAFRAGALAFAENVNSLRVMRAPSYTEDDIAKWAERNRVLFGRVQPE